MFVCLHSWLVLSPYPGVPLFICNTGAVWHITAKAKEASCPTGSAFFRITEEFLLSSLKHAVKHFLLTGLPCPNDRFPHSERDLNCLALFIPANVPQTGLQLRKLIRHRQSLNANESAHVCEALCVFQGCAEEAHWEWQPLLSSILLPSSGADRNLKLTAKEWKQ